jgi:hypothetical protein
MKADNRFIGLELEFWANVKLLNQRLGYFENKSKTNPNPNFVIPTIDQVKQVFDDEALDYSQLIVNNRWTKKGKLLNEYFIYRKQALTQIVEPNLMKVAEAQKLFLKLRKELKPNCPLPMNKQSGNKKDFAFYTGIINMLIEFNAKGSPCDFNPMELTAITINNFPARTLSRRVDGAFPSVINPKAIWEIKEYYYTTTFGSRIADGVYESQLDGMELLEIRENLKISVGHYLMIDAYDTWWKMGKSYLCRICDMLHMGILTEALFGKEVITRIPQLVKEWKAK